MPINVPPTSQIAQKWKTVTPTRVADYENGIQNPKRNWESATLEAANLWITAMQTQRVWIRWGEGVQEAGNAKWKANSLSKGVARWGPGVTQSGDAYARGFSAYRDVIANLDLPPRGAPGSQQNIERVRIVATALHNQKVYGSPGGP
ncbi:MAG: hypothetical protein GF350_04090 [Chitinivibrionales bacterium]|nr:hypothetical protein [Chitinivibrionales bacterium]